MKSAERPSKATPPTRRGVLTRAKLIEAGREVFSNLGYDGARVADVVRIAGVSHGNFYRHFADLDDLLHVVLAELHESLRQPKRVGRRSPKAGLFGNMVDFNVSFFKTYAQHRDMLRVAREAAAKPGANSFLQTWLDMRVPFIERNQRWMARMQASGDIEGSIDVFLMAEALGAMIEQLAYVHIAMPKECPSDERLEELGQICGLIWFRSIIGESTRTEGIANLVEQAA